MIIRWHNEKGEFVTEIFVKENKVYDMDNKELPIPAELLPKDENYFDLVVDFKSSGYYDSGCTYGPPDNWYPPEEMDEREQEKVYIIQYITKDNGKEHEMKVIELNDKLSESVFEHFEEDIYITELKGE
jgi:hypothetical protein